jgi:folate-binding protein YgfZ
VLVYNDVDATLYDSLRHLNGIAEGARELVPDVTIPHEANVDLAGGIDFQKGCYLGQELVARTQHQGLVRKRLMPLVAVSDQVADPAHPFHNSVIASSWTHLIPPTFSHAVEQGWINPEVPLDAGWAGSPLVPFAGSPNASPAPASRFASSVVSTAPVLGTAMSMMRLDQLFSDQESTGVPPVPVAEVPSSLRTSLFQLRRPHNSSGDMLAWVKPVIPLHWQLKDESFLAEFNENVELPLRTVQWDSSPNVTRPY